MTSVQTLLTRNRRAARLITALLLFGLTMCIVACEPRLRPPDALAAPHGADQVWGVAPFANESGVSVVDADRLSDLFAQEAQHVTGIDVVPVNRVIAALREMGIAGVRTEGDAMMLMNTLGLDGLVVGTITAYDPYRPPTLGIAVQLFVREVDGVPITDPWALTNSTSGHVAAGDLGPTNPVAQAAGVFDAANHTTLAHLKQYADGRVEPDSAYGRDIYLVSMDLYAKFVSHRLIHDLLRDEQVRVNAVALEEPPR